MEPLNEEHQRAHIRYWDVVRRWETLPAHNDQPGAHCHVGPGIFHGLSADEWSALGLKNERPEQVIDAAHRWRTAWET